MLKRLGQLFTTTRFYQTVLFTMGRILAGFFSAAAVGSLLAALTTSLPFFHRLLAPLLGVIKATPVASFILLCLIWLSSSNTVVLCSFLMVLPLIWANVSAGIESVDPQLLEMGRVFHFSRWKRIRYLYPVSYTHLQRHSRRINRSVRLCNENKQGKAVPLKRDLF